MKVTSLALQTTLEKVRPGASSPFARASRSRMRSSSCAKAFHPGVDSYSAFMEADARTPTGLRGYLRERGIGSVYICGLATDFCVAWSALDARKLGFAVTVIEDACRAIDVQGSLAAAWENMQRAGVARIKSTKAT